MAFSDWKKLLYGLQRSECILFLGPDLPCVSAAGERRHPAGELVRRLADGAAGDGEGEAGRGEGEPGPGLAQIAQRFLAGRGAIDLEMEIAEWREALDGERSRVHEALAALPFRFIISSSHDPLMEGALRAAGKRPAVERYHYKGGNKELLPEPTVDQPVLFYLYGHPDEADSLVLSETQLVEFLAAVSAKSPRLPTDLDAALTNGRFFLFLGFGLHQWYLRMLLHVLKVLRKNSKAFAFETGDSGGRLDNAVLFYRDNFKLQVHRQDVVDFVEELGRRHVPPAAAGADVGAAVEAPGSTAPDGTAGPAAAAPTPAPAARAPHAGAGTTVFICHSSEDKETAQKIHEALARSGLDPWLDQQDLRGGDRWDALIEETIHDVDYFLVLNSLSLARKSQRKSYVNKEIKVALRAEDWRLGAFIVPVILDDAPLLKQLDGYHAVDLRKPDGMRQLTRAIKRHVGAA